ncbi:Kcnmb2 [Phodopus roborovskii]|uniref:Calcium-activated potassium channel subunit beta n=1 Tax=Phodopus roborovskii TaxID=109678 RepID=A0AAU9ZBP5_PHORO|nr:Kcnmb2 [Phodopus roborovskii]
MFIWTSGRTSSSYRHDEKRNIYQKIRDHDLLDKRKTVTALKAGEDRAILLGLAMMVCSIMMYFLLGITLLRSYMQSVVMENFRRHQNFPCYSDPEGNQKSVILTKLYSSNVLFHSLFWPTCMMAGGVAIVAMVKLTQYLSLLCERIQRINR